MSRKRSQERGSIVLFVLFVCLAVALLVQILSAVVICADDALVDERTGRTRMDEKDEALAALRDQLLSTWQVMPWTVVREAPEQVEGAVSELTDSGGWALLASARQAPEISGLTVSGWVERGRDGIDLPLAGLVADSVLLDPSRTSPWLEIEGGEEPPSLAATETMARPAGRLRTLPAVSMVGPGVTLANMPACWTLDQGWEQFFSNGGTGGAAPGPRVTHLTGDAGVTVLLPEGWGGTSAEDAGLLVLTGGARLDARDRGDVYGVVVVDGGQVLLDGTRLHGALFVTGSVDVGVAGKVVFSRSVLRWATDRSLARARLVPGTRSETSG